MRSLLAIYGLALMLLAGCEEPPLNNGTGGSGGGGDELIALGDPCVPANRCDGGFCDDGTCIAYLADDATCTSSTQCASGFCSDDDLCADPDAIKDCTTEGCSTGLFCDTDAVCVPLLADDDTCDDDAQCLSGTCGAGDTCETRAFCDGFVATHYPTLEEPCQVQVAAPTRLAVTATDNATGALSIVDIDGETIQTDVAVTSTDAIPFYHDGKLYLVHRFGLDYVDVLDAEDGFSAIGQFSVAGEGITSPNPQWLSFNSEGLAFMSTFAQPELLVYDYTRAVGEALVDRIDLSAFADADGVPEATLMISCGDVHFVALRRLDGFDAVDCELLLPIDTRAREPFAAPIPINSVWARQARMDPADASGHTALLLTAGIERVNLATGDVSWAVDASLFAAEGLGDYSLMAFDVTNDGETAYVAATRPDWSGVDIWRVSLNGVQSLEKLFEDLNAAQRTLEIVGDELWFGDKAVGGSGMRVYDLSEEPPVETAGPLPTGLPPYSMIPLP